MTGAESTAAAHAVGQARQLVLGGLLIELSPEAFTELANESDSLIITGKTLGFWKEGAMQKRLYLLPQHGMTIYCKLPPGEMLEIEDVLEVPKIRLGAVASLL